MSLFLFCVFVLFVLFKTTTTSSITVENSSSSDESSASKVKNNKKDNNKHSSEAIGPVVGFGTAALGSQCQSVVRQALEAGFRMFDTAEADWWYDQDAVGAALEEFYSHSRDTIANDDDGACRSSNGETNKKDDDYCANVALKTTKTSVCQKEDLRLSTKIGPWDLTSPERIRSNAARSRSVLLGFCDRETTKPYPLDVYIIHAPTCWKGWHPRCDAIQDPHRQLLDLRSSWLAMEAVVGIDHSSRRIGLSNVSPDELLDIIQFVHQRSTNYAPDAAPPRIPDVVQAYADPLSPALELRRICAEHGIEFVSYSTLGTQHQMRNGQRNPVLTNPTIRQLAQQYNRSTAEVVLSWAIQNNMSVIPRSSNPLHIQQLARLLPAQSFLSMEDVQAINDLPNTATV